MIIQLETGQKLEVPDGSTPEQIDEVIGHFQSVSRETPVNEKPSLGKTVFDQGMQGATFGFGDEITDRLGAGIASLATGQKYGDLLNEAKQTTKQSLAQQLKERPVTSIAANIAGGLGTAPILGAAGELTGISNLLRTGKTAQDAGKLAKAGNLALRSAKGSLVGATAGGAYGAGTADEGQRLQGAESGAEMGAAIGAAVPVIGAGLSGVNRALGKRSPVPNADQLRAKASELYKVAEQKGGVLKPEFTNQFVDEIEKLKPQTDIGKIVGGDSPFSKFVEKLTGTVDENGNVIGGIRNKPITLDAAQELDELLGDAIDGFTENGRVTKQGKKLLDIQSEFRNMIENAGDDMLEGGKEGFQALEDARKLWATSRKLADIERIIQRAELMDNPATGIKSGFRTMLSNPSRMRGYSKAEKAAVKKAAESGFVSDILRTAGSRLVPIIAGSSGGGLGGAAAGQAVSLASRSAATKMQVGKATNLAEIVANQGQKVTKQPLIPFSGINARGTVTGNLASKITKK